MKKLSILWLVITLSSCNQNADKKSGDKHLKVTGNDIDTIIENVTNPKLFENFNNSLIESSTNVLGYTYLHLHDYEDDTLSKGHVVKMFPGKEEVVWKYNPNWKVQLTGPQIDTLFQTFNSKGTYLPGKSFCFYPRNCFVFLHDTTVIGYIEICLECSQIESSFSKTNFGGGRLSEEGKSRIINFMRSINMTIIR